MTRFIQLISFLLLLSACAPSGATDSPASPSTTLTTDSLPTMVIDATIEEAAVVITETPLPVLPTNTPLASVQVAVSPSLPPTAPPVTKTVVPSPVESEPTPLPTKEVESTATATATATAAATQVESPPATMTPSATLSPSPSSIPLRTETATPLPTEKPAPTETRSPPTVTISPPTATIEPVLTGVECFTPPEVYQRVQVRGHTLSKRTTAMMENAQLLYGGIGSMYLVIQGSYAPGLGASFGTHDGGGAVDIWTVDPNNTGVLLGDIDKMVWALRQSGFAAWFRPANMLYQGMYPHIHAISIGDKELSSGAMSQLTGPQGYFRGRNGLPQPEFMGPDPHRGPILCPWMQAQGYQLLPDNSSGDEPATEVPATAVPATEVPATEVPATEVPATEVPATEVPATEVPATEVPATEVPATEVPATEVPATEVPATEVPQEVDAPTAVSCQRPLDDYQRTNINGQILNRRTQMMLQTAQLLYGGPGNLLSVTQGSYNYGVTASFGTHDGGGAVDISIRHPNTSEFLYDEVPRMVLTLRQAGFAAWYRSPDQGFVPHIHAIAIGDAELSDAANAQLTGEQGYFRGRNGLPDERAGSDPHGGPWVCDWMKEMGYRDLR